MRLGCGLGLLLDYACAVVKMVTWWSVISVA